MKKVLCLAVFSMVLGWLFFSDFDTDETVVAVLDTGINEDHKVFKDKIIPGYNFIDWNRKMSDHNGHGSGVAGMIVQQDPSSKILPVKVIGDSNYPTITAGVLYAVFKGADVVNMSFKTESLEEPFIQLAVKFGQSKGVIFVGAAGNQREEKVAFPANIKEVYAIGNVDFYGEFSESSNFGNRIDFVTNGKRGAYPSHKNNEKYGYDMSGTSIAAGRFSGYCAFLISQNPGLTKKELTGLLKEKAKIITVEVNGKRKQFKEIQMRYIASQ